MCYCICYFPSGQGENILAKYYLLEISSKSLYNTLKYCFKMTYRQNISEGWAKISTSFWGFYQARILYRRLNNWPIGISNSSSEPMRNEVIWQRYYNFSHICFGTTENGKDDSLSKIHLGRGTVDLDFFLFLSNYLFFLVTQSI